MTLFDKISAKVCRHKSDIPLLLEEQPHQLKGPQRISSSHPLAYIPSLSSPLDMRHKPPDVVRSIGDCLFSNEIYAEPGKPESYAATSHYNPPALILR
jgi:hypothetical protein